MANKRITATDIRNILACLTQKDGMNQKTLATLIGVGASYLNEVIKGTRSPGPKVLSYLGLRRVETMYEPVSKESK